MNHLRVAVSKVMQKLLPIVSEQHVTADSGQNKVTTTQEGLLLVMPVGNNNG